MPHTSTAATAPAAPPTPGTRVSAVILVRALLCVVTITPLLRWMVVIHSVPAGHRWRHRCPRCATPLGPTGSLGALGPAACCAVCRQRLGPPPWMLEAVAIASALALATSGLRGLPLLAYGWWAAFGVVLAFVDLAVQRLPARLSYTATGGLLGVLLLHAIRQHSWAPWIRAGLGAMLAAAILAVCALALPTLVHWGDVRYVLAVGAAAAWVSWLALYTAALLSTLTAALIGIALIVAGRAGLRTHLPQGPFLYAGTLLAVVLLGM